MRSQYFSIAGIANQLDESLLSPQDARFAVGAEQETPDLYIVPLLARRRLRQSHARHLRFAVNAIRHMAIIDRRRLLPANFAHRDNAFHGSSMGQLRSPGHDVADGVNSLLGRLHVLIGLDEAALRLDFGALQTDILRVGLAPNGHQRLLLLECLLLVALTDGDLYSFRRCFHFLHASARENLYLLLFQGFLQLAGDFLIRQGKYSREHFHHRNLRTKPAVNRGELDADRPRPDNQQRLRHGGILQNFPVGEDSLPIGLYSGQQPRLRSSRQDNVPGLNLFSAIGTLHPEASFSLQFPIPPDAFDLVLSK